MTGRVIARCAWTCIRESREDDGLIYYDVWRYSQARGRWARHEQNTGYGDLMEAIRDAKVMSDNLLSNAGFIPAPFDPEFNFGEVVGEKQDALLSNENER